MAFWLDASQQKLAKLASLKRVSSGLNELDPIACCGGCLRFRPKDEDKKKAKPTTGGREQRVESFTCCWLLYHVFVRCFGRQSCVELSDASKERTWSFGLVESNRDWWCCSWKVTTNKASDSNQCVLELDERRREQQKREEEEELNRAELAMEKTAKWSYWSIGFWLVKRRLLK